MEPQKNRPKTPISSFFKFKNLETEKEIINIINKYEGIPYDKIERYLHLTHTFKRAELLLIMKEYLGNFWINHKELAFSDFKGLVSLAIAKIEKEILKEGEKFRRKIK